MIDALNPPARVLAKIGSIIVHMQEYGGEGGHPFDATAARSLLADPEVRQWIEAMDKMALLPKRRDH